jgi:hypothetical protein
VKSNEQRRSDRKTIRHTAWIAMSQPGEVKECVISDVSQTGARIDVGDPSDLPDEFMLFLTRNASMRRKCLVMWREGTQIGVYFDRPRRPAR